MLSRINRAIYRRIPLSRRTYSLQPPKRLEDIGIIRAYGKPVATIFLWSALTYMSFQAIWSKLYFDEIRLETETKIDSLKTELERLQKSK